MRITPKHVLAALAAVGAVAAVATGAFAVSSSAVATDGTITACRHPHGGWIRIVTGAEGCRSREQAISWNAEGQPGPAGPAGPAGPKGDAGAGLSKLSDLAGIACTTDSGASGKVELDFAGDDTVLFRCVAGSTPPPPPPSSDLVINEVDYDQVGADGDGFVEIKNKGTTAATLTGIALVFVDGADGEEYRRQALTGTLDAGAYAVVALDAQNGAPDGLALIDSASGSLLDALSYEGAIASAVITGNTYSLVEGTVLPATVADSNSIAGSLIRNPDGKDTNDAASDWAFTKTPTRGAANVLTP
jgi:hypothetical protein